MNFSFLFIGRFTGNHWTSNWMNPNAWRNVAKYYAQELDASVAHLHGHDAQLVTRCAACINPVLKQRDGTVLNAGILNCYLTRRLKTYRQTILNDNQSPCHAYALQDSNTFLFQFSLIFCFCVLENGRFFASPWLLASSSWSLAG